MFGQEPLENYVFSTFLAGIGALLLALSNRRLLGSRRLSTIGRMTLGIYALRLVYVELFSPIDDSYSSEGWQIIYPVLVLGCALFTTYALSQIRLIRNIVV